MFNPMQIGSKGAAAAKILFLQRKIAGKKIEVENNGVKVVVTGEGKIKSIEIDGQDERRVLEVVNEAITKAQTFAAEEMKGSMGDLSKIFGG